MPRAIWSAAARVRAQTRASRRHEHAARRTQRARVRRSRRKSARSSDRSRVGPRGSAFDLSGRHALARRRRTTTARDRHRRRLDRVHPRRRPRAARDGFARDGLRRVQRALLRRRRDHARAVEASTDRRRSRAPTDPTALPQPRLGELRRFVGHDPRRGGDPARQRLVRRRHHATRIEEAAQGARRSGQREQARPRGHATGSFAGDRRRIRDSRRGVQDLPARADGRRNRRVARRRAARPRRSMESRRRSRKDDSRLRSTLRSRRRASGPRRAHGARLPRPSRRGVGSTARFVAALDRVGGATARDRSLGRVLRVSPSRRVSRAERRHARILEG